MGILFFIFWVVSFLPIVYSKALKDQEGNAAEPTTENGFIFVYIFMLVFMNEFLFYVETFLIATACADWYYSVEDNYYTTAIGRINPLPHWLHHIWVYHYYHHNIPSEIWRNRK